MDAPGNGPGTCDDASYGKPWPVGDWETSRIKAADIAMDEAREKISRLSLERAAIIHSLCMDHPVPEVAKMLGITRQAVYRQARKIEPLS